MELAFQSTEREAVAGRKFGNKVSKSPKRNPNCGRAVDRAMISSKGEESSQGQSQISPTLVSPKGTRPSKQGLHG